EKIPEENWLVIPCIGVDALIAEGETGDALDRGVWHRPRTGSPDSGGNMVLTAHRFKYLPPNNLTFYHLDKIRKSDKVIVYWNEIEYDYVVTEVFIVDPDRVDIEDESVSPVLTLYTCTPLWTADQRLVVIAEPVEQDSEE
ncbi:MAG: class E sortase, partial [Patescibacteria group bacterium]|nr:class E sortase [Patescibacteria group bacterium]